MEQKGKSKIKINFNIVKGHPTLFFSAPHILCRQFFLLVFYYWH